LILYFLTIAQLATIDGFLGKPSPQACLL